MTPWHTCSLGCAAAVAALSLAGPAMADDEPYLASKEAGMEMVETVQAHIAENGIEATMAAIIESEPPFAQRYPAVAIERVADGRIYVEAHTVYNSLQGIDFTDQTDLEGRKFMQNFYEQVKNGGGTAPTTNAPPPKNERYPAECYNEWAKGYKGKYFITVCYDRP